MTSRNILYPPKPRCRKSLRHNEGNKNLKNDQMQYNTTIVSAMNRPKKFKEDNLVKDDSMSWDNDDDDDNNSSRDHEYSNQNLDKSSETYAKYVQTNRDCSDSSENMQHGSLQESSLRSHYNPQHPFAKLKENVKQRNEIYLWLFSIITVIIVSYFLLNKPSTSLVNDKSLNTILKDVQKSLINIQSRFKEQEDTLWKNIFGSIAQLFDIPTKPSIIILLGTDADPLNCLATMVGNVSSMALHSKMLQLTPKDLHNDMGIVIQKLRSEIPQQKAVVVWDLLSINTEALKAFHNLCDRYNPVVNEVIFIIVVIAENYHDSFHPLQFIENSLRKKLSGNVDDDIIQPLISRITDGAVLFVKPEPDILNCPLATINTRY